MKKHGSFPRSVMPWCASFAALGLLSTPLMADAPAAAPVPSPISAGDTAWVLVSAALVLLMTPGLALFYGGMVRRKNVLSTMMQSFILMAFVSLLWVLFGYSLAFGPDTGHGLIGGLAWVGLRGVGAAPDPAYAPTIPHQVFMIYQMMFAVITPALITGAFAERMKFSSFLVFSLLWTTFIYLPVAHWIWGQGGWLRERGALDFAGGMVVHLSAGVSALVAAVMLGKRRGLGSEEMLPHNMTMVLLGTGLLWFGWFGFNAGSALGANALAATAFLNTNTAAAAGTVSWLALEWTLKSKPTALGAASGAVAGLATITPAAGFVTPMAAIAIGAAASLLCYNAIMLKNKLGYDDSLDAFGVHGVGGLLGSLALGLFATTAVNPAGADGWFHGNPHLFFVQCQAVLAVAAFSAAGTFVILRAVEFMLGARAHHQHEEVGLDLTQHGESGYEL